MVSLSLSFFLSFSISHLFLFSVPSVSLRFITLARPLLFTGFVATLKTTRNIPLAGRLLSKLLRILSPEKTSNSDSGKIFRTLNFRSTSHGTLAVCLQSWPANPRHTSEQPTGAERLPGKLNQYECESSKEFETEELPLWSQHNHRQSILAQRTCAENYRRARRPFMGLKSYRVNPESNNLKLQMQIRDSFEESSDYLRCVCTLFGVVALPNIFLIKNLNIQICHVVVPLSFNTKNVFRLWTMQPNRRGLPEKSSRPLL